MEKKQKGFDKIIDGWQQKYNNLNTELEACKSDSRLTNTELFRVSSVLDESNEQVIIFIKISNIFKLQYLQIEVLKRENNNLAQEIKDLNDQLNDGGCSVHEEQKLRRRLELEKDELQQALEDVEAVLEAEESKVLRAQVFFLKK